MRTEYFCLFTTPQAFWQSSAPGALSTLVISVILYSLTRATLMSPGKDETRVCGYNIIYILYNMYMLLKSLLSICKITFWILHISVFNYH